MRPQFPLYLFVLLTLSLSGCPDEPPPPNAAAGGLPFVGRNVTISVPGGQGFALGWESPLAEWSAQTGAMAQVLERASPAELAEGAGALSASTQAVVPLEQVGDQLGAGALAAVDDEVLRSPEGLNWLDVFPGLRNAMPAVEKQPAVVPLSFPVLICYYREDLLRHAQLSPPKTWEEYEALLETLADWAPGLEAVEPWGSEFRGTMLLARSVSRARHPGHYSLFFDIDNGRPLIASPGFVRGLELAKRALPKLAPDALQLTPAQCRERILTGRAALGITYEPLATDRPTDAASDADPTAIERPDIGTVGFCRLPGSAEVYNPTQKTWEPAPESGVHYVTYGGFSGWGVVGSGAAQKNDAEAGWNAISHLGGLSFVGGFPKSVTGICRESQATDILALTGSQWRASESENWLETVVVSLRETQVVWDLPVPRRTEFLAILSREIEPVLSGKSSAEEALQKVSDDWEDLTNTIGRLELRTAYRHALGLSAASSRD